MIGFLQGTLVEYATEKGIFLHMSVEIASCWSFGGNYYSAQKELSRLETKYVFISSICFRVLLKEWTVTRGKETDCIT